MVWRLLIGAAIGGFIALIARTALRVTWRPGPDDEPFERSDTETEPVLGYDGMERDDVVDWLDRARPDADVLGRIAAYERQHRNRLAVLEKVNDMKNGSSAPPSDRQDDMEPEGPGGMTEEI